MSKKFKPFKYFNELTKKQQSSLADVIPKKDRPYACCFTYGHKAYTLRQMTEIRMGVFVLNVDQKLHFTLTLSEDEANEYSLEVISLDGFLFVGTVGGFLDSMGV